VHLNIWSLTDTFVSSQREELPPKVSDTGPSVTYVVALVRDD